MQKCRLDAATTDLKSHSESEWILILDENAILRDGISVPTQRDP